MGPMPRRLQIALVVLVAGCAVAEPPRSLDVVPLSVQDGPPGGTECAGPGLQGQLTEDSLWGLAVHESASAVVHPVMWPPAFAAAREAGRIELLDATGRVVAREGDVVSVPGENHDDDPKIATGVWFACRNITAAASSSP